MYALHAYSIVVAQCELWSRAKNSNREARATQHRLMSINLNAQHEHRTHFLINFHLDFICFVRFHMMRWAQQMCLCFLMCLTHTMNHRKCAMIVFYHFRKKRSRGKKRTHRRRYLDLLYRLLYASWISHWFL